MSRPHILIFAIVGACVAWIAACGDGSTDPVPPPSLPPEPPRATTVTISPPRAELTALGETVQFAAQVRDQNGQVMAGVTVTWSTGRPAVATVDASGLVTAAGNGMATISATAGSASGTAEVTVMQTVDSVAVSPGADTIAVGDTLRLAAEAFDRNGQTVAGAVFEWSSDDASVATVDSAGLVSAAGNGTATISATAGSASGTAEVTVMQTVDSVAVSPGADTIAVGDTLRLAAEAFDRNGQTVAGAVFEWSSDDPSVAVVDTSGLVTGVAAGEVEITATSSEVTGRAALSVVEPAPETDRDRLIALYTATGGDGWSQRGNWLTDTPIGEWYGVSVNDQGAVVGLDLGANNLSGPIPPSLGSLESLRRLRLIGNRLTGPIPPELGGLANLEELWLHGNPLEGSVPAELGDLVNLRVLSVGGFLPSGLTGGIPAELGRLINLETLQLFWTDLTGPIPPELGNLHNLRLLRLNGNELSGPIPPELGALASLEELVLPGNGLAGPIPSELGDLPRLRWLALNDNALTGPIPPALGDLAALEQLHLSSNDLAGAVPPEFGGLLSLRELLLRDNPEMSGSLPSTLTRLTSLEVLQTDGTSLCAPTDASFRSWIETVPNQRVAACGRESANFYLVQAVQSRQFPVALVAGEEALLRVFVTAERENDVDRPPVRASFYLDGALADVVDIPGRAGPVPTAADESSLAGTANAVIRAALIEPGLEVVVEIDPAGVLPGELGITKRIPETGRAPIDVRAMPLFALTLVPFLWTENPDSAVLAAVDGMAEDPEGHELLRQTHTLLPVVDLGLSAHEPVMSSSRDATELLNQTHAIQAMEGGDGHYMGLMSGLPAEGAVGLAHIAGRTSFSVPDARIMAHELGHNLSLLHTAWPPPVDQTYPHPQGTIGTWGYSHDDGELVPPEWYDLMSYSFPGWISDYHFSKALRFRMADESGRGAATGSGEALLLWGGVDAAGVPYLEPAFVVDAPIASPPAGRDYRIVGVGSGGRELFSLRFGMLETADGEGGASFAFVVPADPAWAGALSSITLSGPGGSATLDRDTDRPAAILRDRTTGQVRAILRDLRNLRDLRDPVGTLADAMLGLGAAEDDLTVRFSRGIPDGAPWRR